MTEPRVAIGALDLLAYADGLLEADPARKAAVETYLRQHPEAGARVQDYAAQNRAIRQLYRAVLSEPVPERLWAVLEARRQGWALGAVARAAIAAGLILGAGVTGWLIGQRGASDPWPMQALVEQMRRRAEGPYVMSRADSARALEPAREERAQPLDWLSHQMAVSLQLPDLTAHGFTVVEKRLVSPHAPQAVQVIYATPSGRRLSLFLRTRWQDETPQVRFAEKDGVTMVYGLEGPLAYALAGPLERQEMEEVVQTLRTSMRHQPPGALSPIVPETVSPDPRLTPQVSPPHPVPSKYP